MSKLAKKPIKIPEGVQVSIADGQVVIKGLKGEQIVVLHPKVKAEASDGELKVRVSKPEDKRQRALWGTFWSLINNAVKGVTAGFEKKLEVVGVGYKVAVAGPKLTLNVGFSHPVEFEIPKGLEVKAEKNTISITGIDKQMVGQFAAIVRSVRKPEPYKGKGIKYSDEIIRRKAGKVVKAVGAG